MNINLGQKIFGFLILLGLFGGMAWLWLASQQPTSSGVDNRLAKAISEKGTLAGDQAAAQATLEAAGARVSTLQADVITVQAIGFELTVMGAQMATGVAIGEEQATRIIEIEQLLYVEAPPEPPFSVGLRELYAVVGFIVLAALGFLAATFINRPVRNNQESAQSPVNPRSYTAPRSTTQVYVKKRDGSDSTRR